MNNSGLHPLGRCVLVETYEPEKAKSVIVMPDSVRENEMRLEMRARVIEVGPACWPDEPPRARPGDLVMIAKMSGAVVTGLDGKKYRAINDRDVFLGIEDKE